MTAGVRRETGEARKKRDRSLSFLFLGCHPRFSRLVACEIPLLNLKEKRDRWQSKFKVFSIMQ